MKVKRMGITEILRRIWLFSANKVKSSESFSKQPTQLIVQLIIAARMRHSCQQTVVQKQFGAKKVSKSYKSKNFANVGQNCLSVLKGPIYFAQ